MGEEKNINDIRQPDHWGPEGRLRGRLRFSYSRLGFLKNILSLKNS